MSKGLEIDMCAGSELKDTQGETLSVEGADISDLEAGRGRFNDNHGKGFFNSLGRITEAKKIFTKDDCENERHEYYWEKIKAPYIYCRGKLYSDEDHPNARAAAAILRNIHKEDAPLALKASVEGGVVSRGIKDPTRLARTKIHSVAITFTPANNATLVEPLELDKSDGNWDADMQLIKSVMHLAETNVPSFRHIERHASANTIHDNIMKIKELAKSIGVDIEIKESDPKSIMKNAVFHKIGNNVRAINELVKALNAPTPPTTPAAADTASPVKTAAAPMQNTGLGNKEKHKAIPTAQHKVHAVVGKHATKAATDPDHLFNVYSQIHDAHGPEKAMQVVQHIQSKMKKSIKESMIKALTAGYGGAGAPGNLTGGGVVQAEKMDDGRGEMKYITCNDCGSEQVYMKHQVKCRSCNRSFAMDKLKGLI